jgi:hypothetical protein
LVAFDDVFLVCIMVVEVLSERIGELEDVMPQFGGETEPEVVVYVKLILKSVIPSYLNEDQLCIVNDLVVVLPAYEDGMQHVVSVGVELEQQRQASTFQLIPRCCIAFL